MDTESTYTTLVKPIEHQMIAVVWKALRNSQDFDDAFQDATLKIWKHLGRIKRHPNPQALILRICINSAYDTLRRNSRRKQREILDAVPEQIPAPAKHIPDESLRDDIMRAVGTLPRNQAQAVLMRFVQGDSYGDIAQSLRCSEATVRTHIVRACRKLRQTLSGAVNY